MSDCFEDRLQVKIFEICNPKPATLNVYFYARMPFSISQLHSEELIIYLYSGMKLRKVIFPKQSGAHEGVR